jgi:hypothetical protein
VPFDDVAVTIERAAPEQAHGPEQEPAHDPVPESGATL